MIIIVPLCLYYLSSSYSYIKLHKQITSSLLIGSPSINETYYYIMNDKVIEEIDILKDNRLIKLQDVAPNWVHKQA